MIETVTNIDYETAGQIAGLTERTYGGTYYDKAFLGEGLGWVDPKETYFLAKEERALVGVAALRQVTDSVALLHSVIVDPRYQGNGISSGLNSHRIEYLNRMPHVLTLVENRAHMPGSYIPLYKKGELAPIALGPYDVLPTYVGYTREHYYVGMRGPKVAASVEDINNTNLVDFSNLFQESFEIDEDSKNSLEDHYKDQLDKLTQTTGGKQGIYSPEGLLKISDTLSTDENLVLYLTGVNPDITRFLSNRGFVLSGLKPFLDFTTADGRVSQPGKSTETFWLYTKIIDSAEKTSFPPDPKNFRDLPENIHQRMNYLYQNLVPSEERE